MNAPQVTMIVIFVVALLLAVNTHGKVKTGYNNFWASFVAVVIEVAVLCWGGFFK